MPSPSASTALVTLAIGESFERRWERVCRPNWEMYAARQGYDVVCIKEPLDTSPRAASRSPAWQKCLVLGEERVRPYDRVIWVDADVLINPDAPSMTQGVPRDKVGAVDEFATPSPVEYRRIIRRLYRYWESASVPFCETAEPRDYYSRCGLPPLFDAVVLTGLMVLTPTEHRELLESTYERYEERGSGWHWGEMGPLSWEILAADRVAWMDHRFNYVWWLYKAQHFPHLIASPAHESAPSALAKALSDVYCLHFAGTVGEMQWAVAGASAYEPVAPHATPMPELGSRSRDRPSRAAPRSSWLRTPVALIVFNRPDTTRRVFEVIRRARPARLLVIADAPRADRPDDEQRCREALTVVDDVDWDCEVSVDVAAAHLGVRERVVTGLDRVFQRVERAIILEDDCVPDPTFFSFCEQLLDWYASDTRVMAISGANFQFGLNGTADSYYFSRYPLIWGWATWRRAWQRYDGAMSSWPELRAGRWLERRFDDPTAVNYWTYILQLAYDGLDAWDYAFLLACWVNEGLTAVPGVNLVTNVGFRADATTTKGDYRCLFSDVPIQAMTEPLRHPSRVEPHAAADSFLEDIMFSGNSRRMFSRLRQWRSMR